MYIELKWVDLVAGYRKIRCASSDLQRSWSKKLSVAYQRKSSTYKEEIRAKSETHENRKKNVFGIIIVSLGFLLIGSILLFGYQNFNGFFLLALGVLGLFLSTLLWLSTWGRKLSPPSHPLREPLRSELFPSDMLSKWGKSLATPIPSAAQIKAIADRDGNHGLNGEYDFIRIITPVLPSNSFIIRGLCQNFGDDLDVVIVGSQGIWLFEVKYWSGKIIWHDGLWERIQYDHSRREEVKRPVKQGPDDQWRRYRDEILKTMQIKGNGILNRYPTLKQIHGGVVFSLLDAKYDIPPNPPFRYGKIDGWRKVLSETSNVGPLKLEVILEVLDILLVRHHEVKKGPKVSALNLANSLTNEAANRIAHWINDD